METEQLTYTVTAEGARFRWAFLRNGKVVATGTRKREKEAHQEGAGWIRFSKKMARRDRRA